MKLNVLLGIDLSAYAEVEVEVDLAEDVDALIEAVQAVPDHEIYFEVDWDSSAAKRIVRVRDDLSHSLLADIPIEPVPYNGGYALADWLNGKLAGGLSGLIDSARENKLIESGDDISYAVGLKGPDGEVVEVDVMARPGATREELLVAFMDAATANGWSFGVKTPATAGGAA